MFSTKEIVGFDLIYAPFVSFCSNKKTIFFYQRLSFVYVSSLHRYKKKTLLQTLFKNFKYFSDYLHVYLALLSLIMETTKTEYLEINVFQKQIIICKIVYCVLNNFIHSE